jgi:uncharacterized membrane protein
MIIVDVDWKTELLKRFDTLADKLGTTGTYLWHILVKQGYIEGWTDLFISIIFAILLFISAKIAYKKYKKSEEYNWNEDTCVVKFIVFFTLSLIFFIISATNLYMGIQEILNPEFYALNILLEKLGH